MLNAGRLQSQVQSLSSPNTNAYGNRMKMAHGSYAAESLSRVRYQC